MAKKAKIAAAIVLDGEKEFKAAVTACNKKLSAMRSELNLNKEKFADNANSLEALSEKNKILSDTLTIQREKMEATQRGYEHAVEVQKKVKNGLEELKQRYTEAVLELGKMERSADSTDKELEKQRKVVKELSSAITSGENNYEKAGNRIEDWRTKLNTAEGQVIKASKALNQNQRYFDEAKSSTDRCATSIDKFGKRTKETTEQVVDFGDLIKTNIGSQAVIEGVKSLANALKGVGEAAVGAVQSTALYVDDINTLATQTGLSTDFLQEFKYMEDLVDVSMNTVTSSMAKNIRAMSNAKKGSEEYTNAYKKLGVSVTKSNGELRDSEEVYWDVVGALGDMANETERDATAMTIFGKKAQDLNPLIMQGSEGINALKEEAKNMGAVMDGETMDSMNAVNDQFDRMKQQSEVLKREFGVALAPTVSAGMQEIGEAIQENKEDWIDFAESGVDAATKGLTWVIEHKDGVVTAISAMAIAMVSLKTASTAMNLAGGIGAIASMATPIGLVAGAITAVVGAVIAYNVALKANASAESEEIKVLNQTIDALEEKNNAIKETMSSIEEGRKSTEADIYATKEQVKRLMELNSIEKKTKAEKMEMTALVNSLSGQIKGLKEGYDAETGSLCIMHWQVRLRVLMELTYLVCVALSLIGIMLQLMDGIWVIMHLMHQLLEFGIMAKL